MMRFIAPVSAVALLAMCVLLDSCTGQRHRSGGNGPLAADVEAEMAAEYVQRLETLVEQYRQLIAKAILRLNGACLVYDRLAATSERNWYAGERMPGDEAYRTVDIEQYILAVLRQLQAESPDQIADTFARQNATEPGVNVLFYIVTTSNMLKDPQLDTMLAAMLFDQCCTLGDATDAEDAAAAAAMGGAGRCDPTLRKRQAAAVSSAGGSVKTPQKKQRFHAWGGKRSRGGAPGSGPAQVVIRAPFHAWGGRKRSVADGVL